MRGARPLPLAVAGVLFVACNAVSGVNDFAFDRDPSFTPGTSSSGGGGGGAQGGGGAGFGGSLSPTCDDEPVCGGGGNGDGGGAGCLECAVKELAPCGDAATTCKASTLCNAFASCMDACALTYSACLMDCETKSPGGTSEYAPLARCLYCDVCTTACVNPGVICGP